ncbi:MAG: PQQ-binding-like beta-propeller repeat protein, partial [Fimbriiglobus sp.]
MRPLFVFTLALTLALVPAPALSQADWPRFRGPNGSGIGDPTAPYDLSKAGGGWKIEVPGFGHSSPVVAGGRVYLQSASRDGVRRTLFAIDAKTGVTKWAKDLPGGAGHTHKKSSLASGTPAVDGDRVFVTIWDGAAVTLHAFDLDGKPVWSAALGAFSSDHGAGMSPVAAGGKVYVVYDLGAKTGDGSTSTVLAFDGKTGAKAWSAGRKAFRHCSASPVLRELPGGKSELVVATSAGVTGYAADTGTVNWHWVWNWNGGQALRTVGSPLALPDGSVVAVSGDGGGSRSTVRVIPGEKPALAWEKKKGAPYVPTPLAHGGHLYWITDDGQAVCADPKSGDVVWSERVFSKAVSASPILIGDKILAVAEDGKWIAFPATPKGYDAVATGTLNEGVFATPAAADGRVYVRGFEHLFCFAAK